METEHTYGSIKLEVNTHIVADINTYNYTEMYIVYTKTIYIYIYSKVTMRKWCTPTQCRTGIEGPGRELFDGGPILNNIELWGPCWTLVIH